MSEAALGRPANDAAPKVRLEPMTQADFEGFFGRAVIEYAQDKVRAGQWPADDAEARSLQALTELLPAGPATADHRLYVLLDRATAGRVGTAWLHIVQTGSAPFAYVCDIRVDDEVQGRGYGRAALRALEAAAADAGCSSLQLHVFGHNARARHLYESSGYRVTNLNLRKDLG